MRLPTSRGAHCLDRAGSAESAVLDKPRGAAGSLSCARVPFNWRHGGWDWSRCVRPRRSRPVPPPRHMRTHASAVTLPGHYYHTAFNPRHEFRGSGRAARTGGMYNLDGVRFRVAVAGPRTCPPDPTSGARFTDAVSSFALVWFNVIEIGLHSCRLLYCHV
jgi:hypothetical protein